MLPEPPRGLVELAEIDWDGWFLPDDVMDGAVSRSWDCGVYMWLDSIVDASVDRPRASHSEILYIGKCLYQPFAERISKEWNEPIGRWLRRNHTRNLTIKLGTVTFLARERFSQAMLQDVENLLIITQRPRGNIASTKTYAGRDLMIANRGRYTPLPNCLSTDELE